MKYNNILSPRSIITMLVLMIATQIGVGQVRPDQFPIESNPDDTNFEVYSQKNGTNTRATITSLKYGVNPRIIPIVYVPATSGNSDNQGSFVKDPNGAVWYIDHLGMAVVLSDGSSSNTNTQVDNIRVDGTNLAYDIINKVTGSTADTKTLLLEDIGLQTVSAGDGLVVTTLPGGIANVQLVLDQNPDNKLTKSANGLMVSESAGVADNIYTADDTLTSNRTIDTDGYNFKIRGNGQSFYSIFTTANYINSGISNDGRYTRLAMTPDFATFGSVQSGVNARLEVITGSNNYIGNPYVAINKQVGSTDEYRGFYMDAVDKLYIRPEGYDNPLAGRLLQDMNVKGEIGYTPYGFPDTDGAANQILKTDGAGNLSWANDGGGGSSANVYNTDGTIDELRVIDQGENGRIRITRGTNIQVEAGPSATLIRAPVVDGLAGQVNMSSSQAQMTVAGGDGSQTRVEVRESTNNLYGNKPYAGLVSAVGNTKAVAINSDNEVYLRITGHDNTYTGAPVLKKDELGKVEYAPYGLPLADGAAGEVITTDGNGVLSWGAGGGSSNITGSVNGNTYSTDACDKGVLIEMGSLVTFCTGGNTTVWCDNYTGGYAISENDATVIVYFDEATCNADGQVTFDLNIKCDDAAIYSANIIVDKSAPVSGSITMNSSSFSETAEGVFSNDIAQIGSGSVDFTLSTNGGSATWNVNVGASISTSILQSSTGILTGNEATVLSHFSGNMSLNSTINIDKKSIAVLLGLTYEDGVQNATNGTIGASADQLNERSAAQEFTLNLSMSNESESVDISIPRGFGFYMASGQLHTGGTSGSPDKDHLVDARYINTNQYVDGINPVNTIGDNLTAHVQPFDATGANYVRYRDASNNTYTTTAVDFYATSDLITENGLSLNMSTKVNSSTGRDFAVFYETVAFTYGESILLNLEVMEQNVETNIISTTYQVGTQSGSGCSTDGCNTGITFTPGGVGIYQLNISTNDSGIYHNGSIECNYAY